MHDPEWREMVATLGQQIRTARQLLGWSQVALAAAARTSQGTVSRMEAGNHQDLPLLSFVKVLSTLADGAPEVAEALAEPARSLLACVRRIGRRTAPPADPAFATLLHSYQALSPERRAAFIRVVLPIAAALGEQRERDADPERDLE